MMGQPIQQRRGHFLVAEHRRPFREAEIGGDNEAGPFVQFADQVEQQRPTGLAERQIPQLIKDHEVGMDQAVGKTALLTNQFLLLQRIDQFGGRQEAHLQTMVLDGLHTKGGGEMSFTRARTADQDRVLGVFDELAAVQRFDQGFIDGAV